MTKEQQKVYSYIMADTVRKENFSGIEICSAADNEDANEQVHSFISDYSEDDCVSFIEDVIEGDADVIEGGWITESGDIFPL